MVEIRYGNQFQITYKLPARNGHTIFHRLIIEAFIQSIFKTWFAQSFDYIDAIVGLTVQ